MAMPQPHPELDLALEVTGNIVSAAIQSNKLSTDIDEVTKYFTELYPRIVQLRRNTK